MIKNGDSNQETNDVPSVTIPVATTNSIQPMIMTGSHKLTKLRKKWVDYLALVKRYSDPME